MTYRLGVDVGGTFTDVLLIDERSGGTYRAKTASTPDDQSVGVLRGIEKVCGSAGLAGGHGGGDRAGRLRRQRGDRPGRRRHPGQAAHPARGRRRGADDLADQLLRQRNARAADRGDRGGGAPGPPALGVQRGAAGAARVRAHHHRRREQLRPPAGLPLHRQPGGQAGRRRRLGRPVHPAQRRRPGQRRERGRQPGLDAAVRPGRRCGRRGLGRRAGGLPGLPHLRPGVGTVRLPDGAPDPSAALARTTRIWVDGSHADTAVYDRTALRAGNVVTGPAIITEMDSTTLVLPGHAATVHPGGSLLIRPTEG
jgi:Hydantoinase/oxoprolinase C-terminal domain/Hydantoinase/oxoprolinase N-terminal region